MNTLKTVFLMTLMMVLLLLIGEAFGGGQGLALAFVFSLLMNFGMYWFSDKVVLMMYHAREVTEMEEPRLVQTVRKLATQAQLPMLRVFIIPNETANAFATGRNPDHAAIAVTSGILKILTDDELEGVLSHELAHVKHRDILTGTIVAAMVRNNNVHRANGRVGNDVFRRTAQRERFWKRVIGADAAYSCPDRRSPASVSHFAFAGICRRRRRLGNQRKTAKPGERAKEIGTEFRACTNGKRRSGNGAHVHRESAAQRRNHEALLHPPTCRRSHCALRTNCYARKLSIE